MIRDLLFTEDPYAGLFVRQEAEVKGWNSQHPKLAELIKEIQPKVIVEVGSWLGGSALWMAEHTDAEIVCIDTWTGSQEMWTYKLDQSRYGALKIRHGYPTIYQDFMSNIIKAGKQHQITPFPVPSTVGLSVLATLGVRPDLIYIDADHSFHSVKADLNHALPLWPKVICGDDYHSWPGVGEAVKKVLPTHKVDEFGFWWMSRDMISGNPLKE